MSARGFLDTNVLVYAYDRPDPAKWHTARAVIEAQLRAATGYVSAQVLSEFYVAVTRKIPRPLAPTAAAAALTAFACLRTIALSAALVAQAVALRQSAKLAYWDALMVVAAQCAGCGTLLSEDLPAGRRFATVTVVNPFPRA